MFEQLVKRLVFLNDYVFTEEKIRSLVEQGKSTLDILQAVMLQTVASGSEVGRILSDTVEMVMDAKAKIEEGSQGGSRGIELDRDLSAAGVKDLYEAFVRVELPF